jgi:hypothetical protein
MDRRMDRRMDVRSGTTCRPEIVPLGGGFVHHHACEVGPGSVQGQVLTLLTFSEVLPR